MTLGLIEQIVVTLIITAIIAIALSLLIPRTHYAFKLSGKEHKATPKTYERLTTDVGERGRAFGYVNRIGRVVRLDPERVVFLQTLTDPQAIEAAREEGVLVGSVPVMNTEPGKTHIPTEDLL